MFLNLNLLTRTFEDLTSQHHTSAAQFSHDVIYMFFSAATLVRRNEFATSVIFRVQPIACHY